MEPQTKETTFRSYTKEQGTAYASLRRQYHPNVYRTILGHHATTGGQINMLMDVGCGPGLACHGLASHFAHAVGIDTSQGMISTARSSQIVTATREPVRFEVATAEDLGVDLIPLVPETSIDLIVAANAAHWFDMPRFWTQAASMLRPGGTVAMWASGEICVHPSVPNAAAMQAAIDEHYEEYLKPYQAPGNLLARNRYRDLLLPWTLAPPLADFEKASLFRKEWDVGEDFFDGVQAMALKAYEKAMSTASPVSRWREDHPTTAGTEQDVVRILRRRLERILYDAGRDPDEEMLKGDVQGVMLMVKRK